MDHAIKQRLTGALVIVLLAIFFIPMLLDGDKNFNQSQRDINIPPKPNNNVKIQLLPLDFDKSSQSLEIKQPDQNLAQPVIKQNDAETSSDLDNSASTIDVDSSQRQPSKTVPIRLADKSAPIETDQQNDINSVPTAGNENNHMAWAVQVGGFSTKNNALALRDKLRKAGFPTYVDQFNQAKKMIYRVRVGPVASEVEAKQLLQKVNGMFSFNAIVVNHS